LSINFCFGLKRRLGWLQSVIEYTFAVCKADFLVMLHKDMIFATERSPIKCKLVVLLNLNCRLLEIKS